MIKFLYLFLLIISIAGLSLADYRYKLAFFVDRKRTLITLIVSIGFFLIWDILGVVLNIFYVGSARYLTGIRVMYEVPIEELFFLLLLCYTILLVWRKSLGKVE